MDIFFKTYADKSVLSVSVRWSYVSGWFYEISYKSKPLLMTLFMQRRFWLWKHLQKAAYMYDPVTHSESRLHLWPWKHIQKAAYIYDLKTSSESHLHLWLENTYTESRQRHVHFWAFFTSWRRENSQNTAENRRVTGERTIRNISVMILRY
jgi:hypothetical protein